MGNIMCCRYFFDDDTYRVAMEGAALVDDRLLNMTWNRDILHTACPRCRWANPNNPLYIRYHDEEWGVPCHDEHALYELFILESFQAGLSWETILNKRENFRAAYDGFDIDKICAYGAEKEEALMNDRGIIRNRRKIKASIHNSRIFKEVQAEYGSWDRYIWGFTGGEVIYESDSAVTTSPFSDRISKDLKKRGMSFVGSTIVYAYLQAIGVINAHETGCVKYAGAEPSMCT